MPPGPKLAEVDLAEVLKVSRERARKALARLAPENRSRSFPIAERSCSPLPWPRRAQRIWKAAK